MKYEIKMSVDKEKNVIIISTMQKSGKKAIVNNELTYEDITKLIKLLETGQGYLSPYTPKPKKKRTVKK